MSDDDVDPLDDGAFDDGAFDDPAHDQLRRELADLRVGAPVPAEVVARLDRTLAGLRAERGDEKRADDATASPAPVVPLRRRAARFLVAAAAAVVVVGGGVGVAQLASDGSTGTSGSNADSVAGAGAASDASGGSGASTGTDRVPEVQGLKAARSLPKLRTATFARDAARLMVAAQYGALDARVPAATASPTDGSKDLSSLPTPYDAPGAVPAAPPVTSSPTLAAGVNASGVLLCKGPSIPDAVSVPVTLDGRVVALVFRPPTAGTQVVQAWSCNGKTLLASATVPH